jgi:uncharacterized alkaline shock family protein YloU
MKKIILLAIVLVSGVIQAQGKFEEGMNKAFALWKKV